MKINSTLYLLALLFVITACNENDLEVNDQVFAKNKVKGFENTIEPAMEEVNGNSNQTTPTKKVSNNENLRTDQKIIKNGYMTVESDQAAKTKSTLNGTVKKLGGYFEKENVQNDHRVTSYDLVIRIPAVNFEKLIRFLESGGDKVSNKSISANNVTEEFYDLKTRLENKRAYLKRYHELLNRANSIAEVLQVEEKIRVLEEEIESTEGRMRFLNDQVGYSTLTINLFQKQAYFDKPNEDTFSDRLKKAFSNGWEAIGHFTIAILTLWPFILLGTILVFVYRRYKKRRKK